jgi:biopolymer transport protein ExbD
MTCQENLNTAKPLAEINMIPLIDIMLVLLILFIITAPLFTPHLLKVDVPQASSQEAVIQSPPIILSIDRHGNLYWRETPIKIETLKQQFLNTLQQMPLAEFHLQADKTTSYQQIVEVMSIAQQVGITRLGLIIKPANITN